MKSIYRLASLASATLLAIAATACNQDLTVDNSSDPDVLRVFALPSGVVFTAMPEIKRPGVSGPPVKVLVGTDGTEVIAPGQSAGNTAEGSFHLLRCFTSSDTGSGNTGNG